MGAPVSHQLRSATTSLGVFLALIFVVAPWLTLFFIFARIRFERGDTNRVRVGGSLPRRATSWPAGTPVKLELRRKSEAGHAMHSLVLVVDRHPLVLAITGSEEKTRAIAEQIAAFLGPDCTVEAAEERISKRRGT